MAQPAEESAVDEGNSYASVLSPITTAGTSLPASMRALISSTTSNAASSTQMIAELAPALLQHRMLHPDIATASAYTLHAGATTSRSLTATAASLARRLPLGHDAAAPTSITLAIRERAGDLLQLPIPGPVASTSTLAEPAVSLLTGFKATAPSSNAARVKRRRRRAGLPEAEDVSLAQMARLSIEATAAERPGGRRQSAIGLGTPKKGRRRSLAPTANGLDAMLPDLTREQLEAEVGDILQDQANLEVRKTLLSTEIGDVDRKIAALETVRAELRRALLGLREEHLALEDELEGTRERLGHLDAASRGRAVSAPSSRRRKGPSFLPSEHDDLPVNVSFMTLSGHLDTITALDFTEPYGTLISASSDESLRMWDLSTGEELGFLRGHTGTVKCLQVEGSLCISGGTDGTVRMWDLERAEEDAAMPSAAVHGGLATLKEEMDDDSGMLVGDKGDSACMRVMTGHASAVTACYFEDNCLVTGASDKTLRQWDLTTGQCIMTMDILWAISNPPAQSLTASPPPSPTRAARDDSYFDLPEVPRATPKRASLATLRRLSSQPYGLASPPVSINAARSLSDAMSDTSVFDPDDYAVGGVMHWGYALASGSADGCVRMWDMRTGQAHRTLVGHVAPVSCLQFDEFHLVSGSLDKSIRIWDLRTGSIADTLRYDRPVTALQFDSRKIIAAAGENGVKVFNRTTLQHTTLSHGGHTKPSVKLRFMDRFLATGGRDSTVRLWAIS